MNLSYLYKGIIIKMVSGNVKIIYSCFFVYKKLGGEKNGESGTYRAKHRNI